MKQERWMVCHPARETTMQDMKINHSSHIRVFEKERREKENNCKSGSCGTFHAVALCSPWPFAADEFNSGWQTDNRQKTEASSSWLKISPVVADESETAPGSFQGLESISAPWTAMWETLLMEQRFKQMDEVTIDTLIICCHHLTVFKPSHCHGIFSLPLGMLSQRGVTFCDLVWRSRRTHYSNRH